MAKKITKKPTTKAAPKKPLKENDGRKKGNAPGVKHSEAFKEQMFETIIKHIEEGLSLTRACKIEQISRQTFFDWLEDSDTVSEEVRSKHGNKFETIGLFRQDRYARACDQRQEAVVDEIFLIADDQEGDVYTDDDGIEHTNHNVIQRSNTRIDVRKWWLGKVNPKKYGNKVENTIVGDEARPVVISLGNGIKPTENE